MEDELKTLLPEILWIKDEKLREAIADTYSDALRTGGWNVQDMKEIPFTLLIPNCSVSYLSHVRAVTRMCHSAWTEFKAIYQGPDAAPLEYDILIAGALLHDVGKLVEYTKGKDGKYVKSATRAGSPTSLLRHGDCHAERDIFEDRSHHSDPCERGGRDPAHPRSGDHQQGGYDELRSPQVPPRPDLRGIQKRIHRPSG